MKAISARWSPDFSARPLSAAVIDSSDPQVVQGAKLFHERGCLYYEIAGDGGKRGPKLTDVASRLTKNQMTWRILNGGVNMPAYGQSLKPADLNALVAFLGTRVQPNRESGPNDRAQ